jgi:hypothetical protein
MLQSTSTNLAMLHFTFLKSKKFSHLAVNCIIIQYKKIVALLLKRFFFSRDCLARSGQLQMLHTVEMSKFLQKKMLQHCALVGNPLVKVQEVTR